MHASVVGPRGDASAPQDQDLPPGFRIDRVDWETPVEPGRSIQIENLHGDVRARRNEVPRLDVFVVIQLQEQDPLRADVRIIETPEGIEVDVRYVREEAVNEEAASRLPQGDFIRRVDMVTYIPSGSPLNVRTTDGLIEAREVESNVVAESVAGDITVIAEGLVSAKTSSGSVLSVLLFDAPGPYSSLQTDTGDISLQVPADLDVLLRARTTGRITSEYMADITPAAGDRPNEAVARVGEGTHEVRLESHQGNIEILAWKRGRIPPGDRSARREGS